VKRLLSGVRGEGDAGVAVAAVAVGVLLEVLLVVAMTAAHANPEVRLWSIGCHDDRSYVIRASGPWRPGDSLADEYRVLLHLQGAGVAVPFVTDDAVLCVKDGDTSYVLAPRLAADGDENHELLPKGGDVWFRIGSAIGHLRAALAEYPAG
jgi:hypothetical protein